MAHRVIILLVYMLFCAALAQGTAWEMRVCADGNSLPFSSAERSGFENKLAELLAEELNATLVYDWHTQNPDMIDLRLREGWCDLIMGVPDGYQGLLTTIAYYRSSYVFVYKTDSPFDLTTLDDPVLRELRIGVQNVGIPPHEGLLNRRMTANVVREYGNRRIGDSMSALFLDLLSDETDVALIWGPLAGFYAARQPVSLSVVPIMPEVEPPFVSMVVPMTIGMRMGDVALRDRLDIALATRWEDVQALLRDYGVPLSPLPRPTVTVGAQP